MNGMLPETTTLVAAMEAVASAVRKRRRADDVSVVALAAACEHVAGTVRRVGAASVRDLRQRFIDLKIEQLDPCEVPWNPLRMLNRATEEPTWTRWLAAILTERESGEVVWRALIDVVLSAVAREHDIGTPKADIIASLCVARETQPWRVTPETLTADGGFIDIVLECDAVVVGIENKLWEGWHDRPGLPQDESYLADVRRRAGSDRVAVPVYLSVEVADGNTRRPNWIFITWAELARSLRRQVERRVPLAIAAPLKLVGLLPAILTLGAIEGDLIGLRAPAVDDSWRELGNMTNLVRHLELARYPEIEDAEL